MRFLLLASSVVAICSVAGSGAAFSQEYPYCSTEGVGTPVSCTYETKAQCDAAVRGTGVDCHKNPRYTAPVAATPAPQPAPTAPPKQQKRRTTTPSGTKS